MLELRNWVLAFSQRQSKTQLLIYALALLLLPYVLFMGGIDVFFSQFDNILYNPGSLQIGSFLFSVVAIGVVIAALVNLSFNESESQAVSKSSSKHKFPKYLETNHEILVQSFVNLTNIRGLISGYSPGNTTLFAGGKYTNYPTTNSAAKKLIEDKEPLKLSAADQFNNFKLYKEKVAKSGEPAAAPSLNKQDAKGAGGKKVSNTADTSKPDKKPLTPATKPPESPNPPPASGDSAGKKNTASLLTSSSLMLGKLKAKKKDTEEAEPAAPIVKNEPKPVKEKINLDLGNAMPGVQKDYFEKLAIFQKAKEEGVESPVSEGALKNHPGRGINHRFTSLNN